MTRGAATVHDVASHAGVSIATVSRVTRGVGQVAPETRDRVLAAVRELDYRPSHLGQALAGRRHAALGIVFPGLSGHYYSEVLQGFEAVAVEAKQSVLILGTHLLAQADEQVADLAMRVDGLAVFGGTVQDETIRRLSTSRVPIVLLARRPLEAVAAVRSENVRAATALTTHLIRAHGLVRLAFLGYPIASPDVTDRWRGFVAAHRRAGITPPDEPIRIGLDQASGLVAASRLLDDDRPPQALVCANDEVAIGAHSAATARGVKIPEQLAITGWDDVPMSGVLSPPLTTVRQPLRELGGRTARTLLARIGGEDGGANDLELPTEVVIRASCGCSTEAAGQSVRASA